MPQSRDISEGLGDGKRKRKLDQREEEEGKEELIGSDPPTRNNEIKRWSFLFETKIIASGWDDFLYNHNLEPGDVLHFSIPSRRIGQNRFRIDYVRMVEISLSSDDDYSDDDDDINDELYPREENLYNQFLFKMEVTEADFEASIISIPENEKDHFEILSEIHDLGNVCFTNVENKNWPVKLVFRYLSHAFTVTDGWLEYFVSNRDWNVKNAIKFYEAVPPSNSHFFVECVKCKDRPI